MSKPKQETSAPRVQWRLPASVTFGDSGRAQVELEDISSRGLFFFTPDRSGELKLEIGPMMPPELERFGGQWVCCQATVVRVEEDKPGNKVGVAAVIDRCEALPQI